eukprot:665359-Amphidinium_carterae.1
MSGQPSRAGTVLVDALGATACSNCHFTCRANLAAGCHVRLDPNRPHPHVAHLRSVFTLFFIECCSDTSDLDALAQSKSERFVRQSQPPSVEAIPSRAPR